MTPSQPLNTSRIIFFNGGGGGGGGGGGWGGTGVTPNMKHETGISVKTAVSHKCCHMPTLLCKRYQTRSPLQVHMAKYCAAIQSWRTSLTVGMG